MKLFVRTRSQNSRCTTMKSSRIPTIPFGRVGGYVAHMTDEDLMQRRFDLLEAGGHGVESRELREELAGGTGRWQGNLPPAAQGRHTFEQSGAGEKLGRAHGRFVVFDAPAIAEIRPTDFLQRAVQHLPAAGNDTDTVTEALGF